MREQFHVLNNVHAAPKCEGPVSFSAKLTIVGALLIAGAGISWLAWCTPFASTGTWLLLVVPVLWVRASSRTAAAALMLGYILAGTHDIPSIAATFFPALSPAVGVMLWLVAGLAWITPWALLWRPVMSSNAAARRATAAVLAVTFAPVGFIGWLTPLALAGAAFPGLGFAGILMTLMLFASVAAAALPSRNRKHAAAIAVALLLASLITICRFNTPPLPRGWYALDTHEGRYPDANDLLDRMQRQASLVDLAQRALDNPGTKLVVLPEEIAGVDDSLVASSWTHVGDRARAIGATILLGLDQPKGESAYLDTLLAFGAGVPLQATARVPMPIGQWHPWQSPSAPIDLMQHRTFIIDGKRVGFSFCYEDFLLWVQILTMLQQRPDVLISIANNWFDPGADAQRIQARHIELWAKLWGLPLLRATNWGR